MVSPAVYGGDYKQSVAPQMPRYLCEEVVRPLNGLEHIVQSELATRHVEEIGVSQGDPEEGEIDEK